MEIKSNQVDYRVKTLRGLIIVTDTYFAFGMMSSITISIVWMSTTSALPDGGFLTGKRPWASAWAD